MSDYRKAFGDEGEELACRALEKKGYALVAAKYTARGVELDLVMRDKGTLVFVEVKRRSDGQFGKPEEAITKFKKQSMIRGALTFVQAMGLENENLRFDVVSIGPLGLRHYKNAFSAGSNYYY